jgi:hypothetical protein
VTEEPTEETQGELLPSKWEWIGTPEKPLLPTMEQVVELLESLPLVYGVKTADYIDYVAGIGQATKISKKNERVERHAYVVRLYMSVGGRLKMLEEAQRINNWPKVKLQPEPVTPTGIPGVLRTGEIVVYRVYCKIWEWRGVLLPGAFDQAPPVEVMQPRLLGYRSGTSYRAGTNSWERAETAATGRALGAWGFGVLPGSGVASMEEMQNPEIAAVARAEQQAQQMLGRTDEEIKDRMQSYVVKRLGVKDGWNGEMDQPNWDKVKTGGLILWRDDQKRQLLNLKAQALETQPDPGDTA